MSYMGPSVILFVLLFFGRNADLFKIGFSLPDAETRIVGGKPAQPNQFPYQVSLQWGLPPDVAPYKHFCGGSIISKKWILTAGHCILAIPPVGNFVVKAGKLNLDIKEPSEQQVKVKKTYVHENYTGGVAPFDIGLIRLEKPLRFNDSVSKVHLPKADVNEGSSILSGWGSISNTSWPIMPSTLQYAVLPLINLTDCKKAVETISGPPLHSTNICTGPLTGGYSACSGDSGGPLVVKKKKRTEVVGVVSWGIIPCGAPGAPSVYGRTFAFVDWIKKTIKANP